MTTSWGEADSTELSELSLVNYRFRLDRLLKVSDKPLLETLTDASGSYDALRATTSLALSTQKSICVAVLSYLKHSPEFARRHPAVVACWQENKREMTQLVMVETDNNMKTGKYMDDVVPDINKMAEVAAKMKEGGLKTLRDTLDYLQLLMVTDMAPKRNDYGALKVFKSAPTDDCGNYVILPTPRNSTGSLVMHDYKTARKGISYREELPVSVSNALRDSLVAFPRRHVFVGRDGKEMSDKAYGDAVKATFRRRMGKNAGMTVIRHAYVTQRCNPGEVTRTELRKTAHAMQHTLEQQASYHMVGCD